MGRESILRKNTSCKIIRIHSSIITEYSDEVKYPKFTFSLSSESRIWISIGINSFDRKTANTYNGLDKQVRRGAILSNNVSRFFLIKPSGVYVSRQS